MPARDDDTQAGGAIADTLAATRLAGDVSQAPTMHADSAATLIADGDPRPPRGEALEVERGEFVGRYVVLARLGAGGMGVVHAAYDPELDRKVALKLLRAAAGPGTAASAGRTRLLREAQALARLSHPHVVAVHDVGTVGDRVWLAMEYVDGQTLSVWLAAEPREWRQIVAVMLAVGRGLAAAHAAGLIHRDLKPDNIMVGRDGRVRVMDFGLARAVGDDPSTAELAGAATISRERASLLAPVTQLGAVMGTPAYMAPEQWRGAAVDPRTDQFAFCVTLWEALFGARPFVGDNVVTLAAAVVDGTITAPPKRSTIPAAIRRPLLRGLAADPARRFPSIDALLAALERALARSRLRKLAVAGVALTALVAAVPLARSYDHSAREAACEAAAGSISRVWDESSRAALAESLRASGAAYSAETLARAAPWIDRWAAEWSRVRGDVCRQADLDGTLSPAHHVRALTCLEERRDELAGLLQGLADDPRLAVVRAVTAAANLSPPSTCADPAALAHRPDPPTDLRTLGDVAAIRRDMMRTQGLLSAGRFADGLVRAEAQLARARLVGYAPLEVEAEFLVGNLADKTPDPVRAAEALTRAYVDGGAIGADDIAARAAIELITVKGYTQPNFAAAVEWGHAAEMLLRRLGKAEDVLGARYANNLAIVYKAHGEFDRAQALYDRALVIREHELGAEHPDVAMLLNNIANLLQARGQSDAALATYARTLPLLEQGFGPDHPHVAATLNNFGSSHFYRGAYPEALALYRRSLALRERNDGPDHPLTVDVLGNIAAVLTAQGDHDAAIAIYERVLAAQGRSFAPDHPRLADTLGNLALAHRREMKLDQARALAERALAIRERSLGPDHPDVAHSLDTLASVELARHDFARALPLVRRAVAIREKALDPDSHELADSLHGLGEALAALGDLAAGAAFLERALKIREHALVADHPGVATTLQSLAEVRRRQGDLDVALALAQRSVSLWETSSAEHTVDRSSAITGLALVLLDRQRPAEAVTLLERSLVLAAESPEYDLNLAETRFALARALRAAQGGDPARALRAAQGGDPARARELAQAAATVYREYGANARAELLAVEAWLKRHEP